jgi:hypothetical protein
LVLVVTFRSLFRVAERSAQTFRDLKCGIERHDRQIVVNAINKPSIIMDDFETRAPNTIGARVAASTQ